MSRGGAGRGQGRKPLYGEPMASVQLRLAPNHVAALAAVGGNQWLRDALGKISNSLANGACRVSLKIAPKET